LTLPGLGSITGGRSVGYAQAGLALIGFGLSLYWLVKTMLAWLAQGELPAEINRTLLIGLAGIVIYAGAWLWALATSLGLLRQAKANEQAARKRDGAAR
jgi:hypothetical protein